MSQFVLNVYFNFINETHIKLVYILRCCLGFIVISPFDRSGQYFGSKGIF